MQDSLAYVKLFSFKRLTHNADGVATISPSLMCIVDEFD